MCVSCFEGSFFLAFERDKHTPFLGGPIPERRFHAHFGFSFFCCQGTALEKTEETEESGSDRLNRIPIWGSDVFFLVEKTKYQTNLSLVVWIGGLGFEPLVLAEGFLRGKMGNPSSNTKPPIQTTN